MTQPVDHQQLLRDALAAPNVPQKHRDLMEMALDDHVNPAPDEANCLAPGAPDCYAVTIARRVLARPALSSTKLLGYQIANENGVNIAGDNDDPSGFPSFVVMSADVAQDALVRALPRRLLLHPIFEGDIEEPEFTG